MRRSLARPWREQRRGKSGDLAWEESLWEKRWNYAVRNSVYGRRLERRRSVRNQEEQTAPTVPGEGFAGVVCLGVSSVGRGASSRRDRMPYQKPFDGGRALVFQARKRRLSSFRISEFFLNEDELLQCQRGVGIRGKSFRCILKIFLTELYVAAGGLEACLHEKIARRGRKGFQLSAGLPGFVCLTMPR